MNKNLNHFVFPALWHFLERGYRTSILVSPSHRSLRAYFHTINSGPHHLTRSQQRFQALWHGKGTVATRHLQSGAAGNTLPYGRGRRKATARTAPARGSGSSRLGPERARRQPVLPATGLRRRRCTTSPTRPAAAAAFRPEPPQGAARAGQLRSLPQASPRAPGGAGQGGNGGGGGGGAAAARCAYVTGGGG